MARKNPGNRLEILGKIKNLKSNKNLKSLSDYFWTVPDLSIDKNQQRNIRLFKFESVLFCQ